MSDPKRLLCPKCAKGQLVLKRWPALGPGSTGGGTYWECGEAECKHRMDKLPSDLRFESVLERDIWLRIFERDGLDAADAAALALRERCFTPASLDLAVNAERERWASRIRQSFVGIRRQETEMVEVTGQPLEPRMVSYFGGMREGLETALRIVETTPIGWTPPHESRKP